MRIFAIAYIVAFLIINVSVWLLSFAIRIRENFKKTVKEPDSIDVSKGEHLKRTKERLYALLGVYLTLLIGFVFCVLYLINSQMGAPLSLLVVVLLVLALAVIFGLKLPGYISKRILHVSVHTPPGLSNKEILEWTNHRHDLIMKHFWRIVLTFIAGITIITAVMVVGVFIIAYIDTS